MIIDSSIFFYDKQIDSSIPPNIPINNCRKALSVPYDELCGLYNNGNTCFFNSALQLLNSMELFRNYFLKLQVSQCDLFSCALKTLFTIMKISKGISINLENITLTHNEKTFTLFQILIEDFYKKNGESMEVREQHDCSEYLIHVLNKIEETYNNKENLNHINNRLSRLYEFNIIKIRNCKNINDDIKLDESLHRSGQIQNTYFKYIPILIKNGEDKYGKDNIIELQNLINDFFSIVKVKNDSKSDKCIKLLNITKDQEHIYLDEEQSIPILNDCNKYIIIFLNRNNNQYSGRKGKITDNRSTQIVIPNITIKIRNRNYKLNSLALHFGGTGGGHYVELNYNDNSDYPVLLNDLIKTQEYNDIDSINRNNILFIYRYVDDSVGINNDIEYFHGININDPLSFINLRTSKEDEKIKDGINLCEYQTDQEYQLKIGIKKTRCRSKYREKYLLNSKSDSSNIDDIFFNKYIHYKNKYLKLKNQIYLL
jgi:ubiquitin C-terminal hydrolase